MLFAGASTGEKGILNRDKDREGLKLNLKNLAYLRSIRALKDSKKLMKTWEELKKARSKISKKAG